MASINTLRQRLIKKLNELFQLDQPDLDFGFYRIMHAKSKEVKTFIEEDLLKIVAETFKEAGKGRLIELEEAYKKALKDAVSFGVQDPESTEPVKKAKAALDAVIDIDSSEADVYDHLYRFFERYYDDGDFISRRYYTRETPGKAAPFAVPYNGEEVKLHWANADQYYVKSTEYFSHFTFDLTQAAETKKKVKEEGMFGEVPDKPLKVHFRIVDATEGDHGNIKAAETTKRFFLIHQAEPIKFNEFGELVVNFEYRPDPEKTGQDGAWRDKRNAESVETILSRLEPIAREDHEYKRKSAEYLELLKIPAPTEKDPKRPLLAKYVNQYTARNTKDYFIHKDLGSFLRRELDFYIKNEVMHLDDIENADAPAVEKYLDKIKVLRKIAGKLIDFLAQLEDFQKKLWLKKKFVVETNYCITLDRVPETMYEEITANEAQIDDWIKLFAIDEIGVNVAGKDMKAQPPGLFGKEVVPFTRPLTIEFLKANDKLVLDTCHFNENFKARLLASIENFDAQCDGLLIHSENFQALNLLQERYREQVKCVYIDPPYNTSATEILYKNSYKHSSWLSLIRNSVSASQRYNQKDGIICIAIDDFEGAKLQENLDDLLGFENRLGNIVVVHNPGGRHDDKFIATAHEYCFFYAKNIQYATMNFLPLEDEDIASFKYSDKEGSFRTREFRRSGNNSTREARPKMFYPLLIKNFELSLVEDEEYEHLFNSHTNKFDDIHLNKIKNKYENLGFDFILPIDSKGIYRVWRWGPKSFKKRSSEIFVDKKSEGYIVKVKDRIKNKPGLKPKSVWYKPKYTAALGTKMLSSLFGKADLFSYPKSISTVEDSVKICANNKSIVFDYFAGSGTTAHAVINLNREDNGKRKYILVEMGDYFDTVLKPRIAKVVYSENWKNGKPVPASQSATNASASSLKTSIYNGVSHCFKYIRLESYEDTLNNLRFDDTLKTSDLLNNPSLKQDYMLHYLLDIETRGSQSLLNIDAFANPTTYTLEVKKPGTDEYVSRTVDLIETFNYLIGLRVEHTSVPYEYTAAFKRIEDPEVPAGQQTKLVLDGKLQSLHRTAFSGEEKSWWFRTIEGWAPADPSNPNNGLQEKVLIVWRKLTGDIEQDNLMLDEWFLKNRIKTLDFEFDTIYVNGSNNLPNLKQDNETWKVRLIEEEFMKRMWEIE
ncbi:MAG: site-specific DNA-methyltransferase [bacterium]